MNHLYIGYKLILLSLACILLAACSSTPANVTSISTDDTLVSSTSPGISDQRLAEHFQHWRGTPYKMGGLSKKGIDCSGFVQVTYQNVFGKQVPRTTEQLSVSGTEIPIEKARLGDLLVFKTGFTKRHVGIYIGNGKFIHASSSKGVMSSSINNPYWADSYQQTRRIIRM